MPPSSKKGTGVESEELRQVHNRELELKRLSGEISCSDCRRLKLKCNKKIPCSSCVRRGAGALCPLGAGTSLSQNSRVSVSRTVSDTRTSNRKLTVLSERIRALEDALLLETGTPAVDAPKHPLLSDELLAIKDCAEDCADEGCQEEEETLEPLGSFGTLSIDEWRTMRYLGPGATESVLLMEALESNNPHPITTPSSLSNEIVQASKLWLFAPSNLKNDEMLLAQIVSHLPPFERATALYEAFFANISWFMAPIERSHVVSELVPMFYPGRRPIAPSLMHSEHVHDLALLLIVLACGSVADLTQSPINDEAEKYHTLTKVALTVRNIMHGASLSGVQAVYLLGSYDVYSGRKSSQEDSWKLIALGNSMAASIGLHRDPSRWSFEPKVVERRRRIFWEVYVMSVWKSIHTGRPSAFRRDVVDCEFPTDIYATIGEDGEVVESVYRWRYRFTNEVLTDVCEKVTSARPTKYREALELDRRVRAFAVHPFVLSHRPEVGDLGVDPVFHELHPLVTTWDKEETLLYIHRSFFARAILEFPNNPMYSPFATSFLATYRSASLILRICRENMDRMYLTILRIWEVWSLALSCGVIAGAVASLGSSINFATSAFVDLEYCISLFEKFGEHRVAKQGLPLLKRMRERALCALQKPRPPPATTGTPDANVTYTGMQASKLPTIRSPGENADDELLIFRGATRVIERRSATPSAQSSAVPFLESATSISSPSHATLMEDYSLGDSRLFGDANAAQSNQSVLVEEVPRNRMPDANDTYAPTSPEQLHEAYPWLVELERMHTLGVGQQTSHLTSSDNQNQAGQQFQWSNTQYGMSAPSVNNTSSASCPSNVSYSSPRNGVLEAPLSDILLDETVSAEAWGAFMEQSGFSPDTQYDIDLDSLVNSMGPMRTSGPENNSWMGEGDIFT